MEDGETAVAAEPHDPEPLGRLFLSFARDYVRAGLLEPGRRLLIVQTAVGGTGFSDHHWGPQDDLCLKMHEMIAQAVAAHPKNRLKALLWHQGETDAIGNSTEEQYTQHLRTLVQGVRETYGVPALPFVAGNLVPLWIAEHEAICAPVVAGLRAVCTETNAAFVESTGLQSNHEVLGVEDCIHFSRAALEEFGRRYFKAYQTISRG
jgi:hypothetical protein